MKCPHCLVDFFENFTTEGNWLSDDDGGYQLQSTKCPSCRKIIVIFSHHIIKSGNWIVKDKTFVRPIGVARIPLPKEVPEKYSKPYIQASHVLPLSAEASAAISRKCLQTLLRDEAKVKAGNLADEIQQVIDSGGLPTTLSESIDAIRNIGNFAAHPIKSTNTGEIVEVEFGEAEWLLDVLEEIIDHYIIKPLKIKAKRDALDQKLKDAGKPPMK